MSSSYISAQLRQQVYERAKGCCEYCLIPELATLFTHQIDHIIAEKHGGLTQLENLALACVICNKYKGSDIASIDIETDDVTALFHPRRHLWSQHFRLENGFIIPLTANARVTVNLLQFNRLERVIERRLLIAANQL